MTHTVEIEQPQVGGRGPLPLIRRYPLISFFVIAFAFTWTYDLLFLVFFPIPDIPGRSTPRDFGPSVAALVVTAVVSGKSGLRRFFQRFLVWRVNPWSGAGVFLLAAVCFSIMIAWVFNHTGGSILMAILLHASINFSQELTSDLFPKAAFNEVGPVVAFSVIALVIVVATRGRFGHTTC